MATLTGAFTALATFAGTVAGMKISYDVSGVPETIDRSALPCAILIPQSGQEIGFSTLAYLGNAPKLSFKVMQLIMYAPTENTRFAKAVPGMIALLDAYIAAIKARPFLVDMTPPGTVPPISQPVRFKPTLAPIEYGGIEYHGIQLDFDLEIYP